ncbi:SDR family oxidoreductase [Burkholderia oklahomensis]|uniref:SDR family oxidoreductase n=1 Tax=Burkholderia oklahomensis TaxID=342113 RepID=UPI00264B105B|nr:SDR family oxidoreductase [Burkholderia oklahomensis]MDN7673482.1 SDR family oxidoreductase [Burkholderia oklahomensis]
MDTTLSNGIYSLDGQRVLIVGGSSGVGLALARETTRLGAQAIIVGRDRARLDRAAAIVGAGAIAEAADVRDPRDVRRLAERIGRIGRIDHLCLSVAHDIAPHSIADDVETLKRHWDSLYWSSLVVVKEMLAHLAETGSITFVTGSLSRKPVAGKSLFTSSQCAIEGMARALAVELAPRRVNTVIPGLLDTPLWNALDSARRAAFFAGHAAKLPGRQIGRAEHVAGVVIACMVNGFVTGAALTVDGGEQIV